VFDKNSVYVCLLTGLAMALAMAGPSASQESRMAIETPSNHENQPSNGWTLNKKLTLRRVLADASAYSVRDDPPGRSLCAL